MAQFAISVLPATPHYMPPDEAVRRAVIVVEKYFPYPRDHEVEVEAFPEPHFFRIGDCERFVCPECGIKVRSDEDDNWYERLEGAENAQNALVYRIETPCCKKQVLLSNLAFDSPWGVTACIARVRVSLVDIDPDEVETAFLDEMQEALGCKAIQMIGGGT